MKRWNLPAQIAVGVILSAWWVALIWIMLEGLFG